MTLRQAQGGGRDTVWQGKHLQVLDDGGWEYAERVGGLDAAVILAIHEDHVLLIEQKRVPTGRVCLELPAGLVGDEGGPESAADAAARELEEETGYRADRVEELGSFYSSPGLTSEAFTLVRATGLTKVGEPEDGIALHRVALGEVAAFVADRRAAGVGIDAKVALLLGFVPSSSEEGKGGA